MSTHPALQPVLRRSNVATLSAYLTGEAERVAYSGDAENLDYFDGLEYAQRALHLMWEAALIATDAENLDAAP